MLRPWLVAFAALLLALPSWATTVAVLPLDQGAGSDAHAGLGTALAGMLIADLSAVEGLVLVERTRLDALLDEMALTETGFLDPSTAQRLGKGLGAESVVTGSWSVVGTAFLLDVRLVDVESSTILRAARADGTVEDFVSVEKQVAEDLLTGLDVVLSTAQRRRLMIETPTESFGAFAAYGEGLARKDEGRLDDAARAFERALGADPAFEAARAELTAIRARVEALRAEDATRAVTDRERRLLAVIAGTIDERTLGPGHKDDLDSLLRWALRLSALDELGRHCERYEEMRHFLDRRRGDVDLPPETSRPYFLVERISEHAWALGLEDKERPTDTYSRDTRIMGAAMPLANAERFVLSYDAIDPGHPASESLWHSMTACVPEETHVQALVKLREALRGWGVTAQVHDRNDVDFEEILEGFELRVRAQTYGADPTLESRVAALLDRHEDGPGRRWATTLAESVVRDAVAWEKHRAMRQGLPEDVLLGMARAVAASDAEYVRLDAPGCGALAARASPDVAGSLARYEDQLDDRPQYAPWELSRIGVTVSPLLDLGCIAGIPARFSSPAEAAAWLDAGPTRARADKTDDPACQEAWKSWGTGGWTARVASSTGDAAYTMAGVGLSSWYGSIESQLCAVSARGSPP